MKKRVKLFAIWTILLSTLWFVLAQEFIEITPNLPSGSYEWPLKIELNSSKPWIKIFYSFNPDATPDDLNDYTWAILLKKSSPLVHFWIESPTSESKIKIENYNIYYSSWITLFPWNITYKEGKISWIQLQNKLDKQANLSFWEIRTDKQKYIIEEWNLIWSWANFEIKNSIDYGSWNIELFSPDWEKKDSIFLNYLIPTEVKPEPKKEEPKVNNLKPVNNTYTKQNTEIEIQKPVIEEKINPVITKENPSEDNSQTTNNTQETNDLANNSNNTPTLPEVENIAPPEWNNTIEPIVSENNKEDTNTTNDLKTSVQEWIKLNELFVIWAITLLTLIFIIKLIVYKKSKK